MESSFCGASIEGKIDNHNASMPIENIFVRGLFIKSNEESKAAMNEDFFYGTVFISFTSNNNQESSLRFAFHPSCKWKLPNLGKKYQNVNQLYQIYAELWETRHNGTKCIIARAFSAPFTVLKYVRTSLSHLRNEGCDNKDPSDESKGNQERYTFLNLHHKLKRNKCLHKFFHDFDCLH